MDISCSFFSSATTPEHIELAEQLGYHRAWCYDSAPLTADVWVTMARGAERTERIGLGPGVLVTRNRHVLTTASAIATLEELAPGRVALAVGTGFSGSRMLGQKPVRWGDLEAHVVALRALLRGERVEWEGAVIEMCHPEGVVAERPIEIPIAIAAEGPKGIECARRIGDGISTALIDPPPGFEWSVRLAFGTVLAEGESPTSDRVYETAGPAAALAYHSSYDFGDFDQLAQLPGGEMYRERMDAVPPEVRHLAVHEGHAYRLNGVDRSVLPRELVPELTLTGGREELREKLDELAAAGVTELTFHFGGGDVERELEAWAETAISR